MLVHVCVCMQHAHACSGTVPDWFGLTAGEEKTYSPHWPGHAAGHGACWTGCQLGVFIYKLAGAVI